MFQQLSLGSSQITHPIKETLILPFKINGVDLCTYFTYYDMKPVLGFSESKLMEFVSDHDWVRSHNRQTLFAATMFLFFNILTSLFLIVPISIKTY